MRRAVGTAVLGFGIFFAASARAQSAAPVDTLAEARRLRDAADYAAAAALMVPYAAGHPEDVASARFAALMAYWSKDFGAARAIYEQSIERHADDAELRVEYAEFLMGTGETGRARTVLTPLVETRLRLLPATRRALTMLGTLEYWRGNYSRARTLFVETLQLDSTDADARRQLLEIELASAAWVRVGGAGWHDDQTLDRATFDAEAGWYLTPVTPLTVRVATAQFSVDDASAGVTRGEAELRTFFPNARMDLSLAGGAMSRSFASSSDWTARLSLGFRLPRHVVLEGTFERAPYTNTVSSLRTAVMTETVDATLRWRASNGWMGDATARREWFDDDNWMTTGYVWFLAPLVRRGRGDFHVGYSFAAQAAERNRFRIRDGVSFPPGNTPATVPGVYDPYYTPRNLRVHSALVSTTARPSARWALSGNASVGVHARDEAPVLVPVPNPPNVDIRRFYYVREFNPWNVRGALEGSPTAAVRLALTGEHGKGAYYSYTTVGLRMTYTFVAAARRRAERY